MKKKMSEKNRINKMNQDIKAWRETCEILSDKNIMKSIEKSLKQIAEGKGIPLSKL